MERESMSKKEMILEAAAQCFARFGFDKTTLDDIGGQVGLNKASLYYYYKNKETIYSEVIYRESEAFLQAVKEKLEREESCREQVHTYISQRLDYFESLINLYQLSRESAMKVQPLFKKLIIEFREREIEVLKSVLDRCIAKGEIKPCDTAEIAGHIITISHAVKHQDFEENCTGAMKAEDFERARVKVRFVIELLLKGLKEE